MSEIIIDKIEGEMYERFPLTFQYETDSRDNYPKREAFLLEQIAALKKERNRLKLFWDTYAREVDKLAFEAQEAALRGGDILGPQEPLGEEFQKVLDDNRDKLYEDGALRGGEGRGGK